MMITEECVIINFKSKTGVKEVAMTETITMKGKALTLKGNLPKVGEKAPDCLLTNGDLDDVKLSSFKGKLLLLMTLPSLDTSVCSREAHRFNEEIGKSQGLQVLAVSMDLPFAQKRWCSAEGVDQLTLLSDYKKRELGEKWGLLIPDLGLLARTVFILDPNLKVLYVELVKEMTNEPEYKHILETVRQQIP